MPPKDGDDGSRRGRGRGRGRDRTGDGTTRYVDRGGIRKRTSQALAVDSDGDLAMGGDDASRGGGRSRDARLVRGARKSHAVDRAEMVNRGLQAGMGNLVASRVADRNEDRSASVRILVLKDGKASKTHKDGGVKLLKAFIERKASHLTPRTAVRIKESHFEGDWLVLKASPEDAAKIVLLNGFSFAGQKLSIMAMEPGVDYTEKKELSEEAKETLQSIRAVLEKRYVVGDKLLDLSCLGQDEKLLKMGFFEETNTVAKLFPVMMVVCNEIFTEPEKKSEYVPSVSLAKNAICNVTVVDDLTETFPDLQNLDLADNQIQDLRGLDSWRHKFRSLERLRLNGNPITTQKFQDYKDRLMEWYPKLHVLNDVQIRTEAEVALAVEQAKTAEDLTPIPIAVWDFRDVANVAQDFLPPFIALYDSDRDALADKYYDDQSILSISVNNRAPRRAEQSKEPVAPWDAYIQKSRNLAKITHLPARMSRTHVGANDIKTFWSTLPSTKHPPFNTEKDKWIVDCHQLPGLPDPTGQNPQGLDGLIISMHGEFTESNPSDLTARNLRSFSRTLVLGPGKGSQTVRVVSDMMAYKAHSTLPKVTQPVIPPEPVAPGEALIKQELVQKLSQHTFMTPVSAEICLKEANWDMDAAYTYFNAHKHEIPPGGWINGIVPVAAI